jgi:hypothetical protein
VSPLFSTPSGASVAEGSIEKPRGAETISERIQHVRARLSEGRTQKETSRTGLRTRLAQWFNFGNFRQPYPQGPMTYPQQQVPYPGQVPYQGQIYPGPQPYPQAPYPPQYPMQQWINYR